MFSCEFGKIFKNTILQNTSGRLLLAKERWLQVKRSTKTYRILILIKPGNKIKKHHRSTRPQMFFKTGVLKNFANFTGKHLCWSLFLIKLQVFQVCSFIKKSPTQVFFCEICEIFKIIYFYRTPLEAASDISSIFPARKYMFEVTDKSIRLLQGRI